MKRTLLLLGLLAAYGAFAFRGVARDVLSRGTFDPLLPLGRAVEERIGERRFADALPVALDLQRAYPSEPQIAYWLARIRHGLNDAAAEAAAWERYVAISPSPAEACPAVAEAYAQLHRTAQALSSYERCVGFAPDDADALMDVGEAYARSGRREEAAAAFERAIRLDPENPRPRGRLAALRERVP